MKNTIFVIVLVFLLFPSVLLGKIGVGVGTGKIQVEDQLKPGIIYELPSFNVINTGDEASDYAISIEYHEQQPELKPVREWFTFSPQEFYLEPGEIKSVDMKLNLPVSMEPGNYFAYIEAHPVKKSQTGDTSINIAAASKLYFTVVPANIFSGMYYKVLSFWRVYAPWPQRVLTIVAVLVLITLFKKFFNIKIDIKGNKKEPVED